MEFQDFHHRCARRQMNSFVIASDGFAVLLEDSKFVLKPRYIAILRDQSERHFLTTTGDQQRNMGEACPWAD